MPFRLPDIFHSAGIVLVRCERHLKVGYATRMAPSSSARGQVAHDETYSTVLTDNTTRDRKSPLIDPSQHAIAMELRLKSRSPSPSRTPSVLSLGQDCLTAPLSTLSATLSTPASTLYLLAIASHPLPDVSPLAYLYTQVRRYRVCTQGESGEHTPYRADLACSSNLPRFPIWSKIGEGLVRAVTGNGLVEVSR